MLRMNRRTFVALAAGAALASSMRALAQQSKVVRIGVLDTTTDTPALRQALSGGLRALGYVEGKNLRIDYRWAEGKFDQLPALAAELVQLHVDIIVAGGAPAIKAAQKASATIPVVMVRTGDPVGFGLIDSLSRPGRNTTGLSNVATDLSAKYVQLLRAAVPGLSRVGVLVNPTNLVTPIYLSQMQAAEKAMNVTILPVKAATADDLAAAFAGLAQSRAGALIALPDGLFYSNARRIIDLAAQRRLPTMFGNRQPVEGGALMSYGQNAAAHFYEAAKFIDKILRGTKAGELPVEQSMKLELVINLKTAKALGLSIPQELLLQADELIR